MAELKLYGVHELAAAVCVRPNSVSVWNRERPRALPSLPSFSAKSTCEPLCVSAIPPNSAPLRRATAAVNPTTVGSTDTS